MPSTPDPKADMRRWVETWKQAGPKLAAIRIEEIRTQDSVLALAQLADAFNHATRSRPPRESSGLIEMHRLFAKLNTRK
jgi:hypothetical protein